jgi:cytohesin
MYAVGSAVVIAAGLGWKFNLDRNRAEFVYTGDEATTRQLLAAGEDVNAAAEMGSTALMQAARSGSLPAVKAILEHKPNVDAADEGGRTALTWSLYMFRLSKDPQYSKISRALLESGASPNKRDKNGKTYLMFALDAGDFESAKLLIDKGVEVDASDNKGVTPLMCAVKGSLTGPQIESICKIMLEKGADPNKRNKGNVTALEMAGSHPDKETRAAGVKALKHAKRVKPG